MLKKELSMIHYINKLFQSETFIKSIPDKFFDDIDGKIVKISFKNISSDVVIQISDNALLLVDDVDKFDVELSASPVTFIMFILSKGSEQFSSKITINGDIDTANKFNQFISSSKKLRELISHILGDNITSGLEGIIDNASSSLKNIFRGSTDDIIDLLTDDINVIPTKHDVNKFLDDVDDLKSRTDKLFKKYNYDK